MPRGISYSAVIAAVLIAIACNPNIHDVRAASVTAGTWPFTIAPVPEGRVQSVYHVDAGNQEGSDANPGTGVLPFRTVKAAVTAALKQKALGIGVKVVIHPGTYREAISLPLQNKETDAPLVIEGTGEGSVILSGSDVWSGWQRQAAPNVYIHDWPYQWGSAPYPAGWEGNVVLAPIVRRREMVFVNGIPLLQVLTAPELVDNSFLVSETDATITIRLAPGITIDQARVEVATRSPILTAQGKTNLVLRKLSFQQGNPAVPDSAVRISDSTGVLVEDCDFSWNNWDGFDVLVSNDVTLRRLSANHNGGSGLGGYKLKRFGMDSSDSSFNNWRGAQGQFFGWAVAGGKFGAVHDGIVSRHRSLANQSRGLWFDYDNVNVSIEQSGIYNNKTDGVFVEANEGPFAIRNSWIAGNLEGSGVSGSNASDVTITNCAVWANGLAQIGITGVDSRAVSNWETGAAMNVRAERWSISSTLIWSSSTSQLWLQAPDWLAFSTTLNSKSNVWSRPVDPRGFQIGSRRIALFEWQQTTSTDLDSTAYIR